MPVIDYYDNVILAPGYSQLGTRYTIDINATPKPNEMAQDVIPNGLSPGSTAVFTIANCFAFN